MSATNNPLAPRAAPKKEPFFQETDQQPFALRVRHRSRDEWQFPYMHMVHVAFNASADLALVFTSHAVLIRGRSLQKLCEKIGAGQVAWIREADSIHEPAAPEGQLHIDSIEVMPAEEFEIASMKMPRGSV